MTPLDASPIRAAVDDLRTTDSATRRRWRWEHSTEIPALVLQPPYARFFRGVHDVLDIGAYTGENMLWVESAGWRAVGVEPNPVAAELAQRANLDVRTGYLADCAFSDRSFDAAYLSYVIEHLLDPQALLQELHRVLRPRGRVLVTTHNVHSLWRYVFGQYWINWHTPFHVFHSHPRALARMIETAGFKTLALGTRTAAFWLLMSLRAGERGCTVASRMWVCMTRCCHRSSGGWSGSCGSIRGFQGDCIIGVFERTD